jgi:glycosyltransferase involved in cell wall biosynthesis
VTLLDLIPMHHPEAMTGRERLGWRLWGVSSARRADRVIAISEAARADIVSTLGLDAARVDVTPLGVRAPDQPRPAPSGGRPMVLCVSQKRAHKNLAALVRAIAGLDATLVLPGSSGPYEDELRRLADELGIADRVRFPGWLEQPQLEQLYAEAACFALPSLDEGFGLPVLEAMATGTPVVTSTGSAPAELADGAAVLVDPLDVQAIAAGIGEAISRRDELRAAGLERVKGFTWEATARTTAEVYREAASAY